MSYADFTLKRVKEEFDLTIIENVSLFSEIAELDVSQELSTLLKRNVPLALAINTEKARSELIIVNVLLEVRKILHDEISFFSGVEFNVDKQRNLNGFCDYIFSQSTEQFFLNAPIITIVEAKNENIIGGLGQCIAEMVAARIFNAKEGKAIETIYGVVTSGNTWKFIKLNESIAHIDLDEYYIVDVNKILAVMVEMARDNA